MRKDMRLPVTQELLIKIISVLPSICFNKFEQALFAAAYSIAFHAFLRVGEICADSKAVSGDHVIMFHHVKILPSSVVIQLQSSKTDQVGNGIEIPIGKSHDHIICPVTLLKVYFAMRSGCKGQLFMHFDNTPLTRFQFSAVLKKSLSFLGIPNARYGSHSFRIGAATSAAMRGVPHEQIQLMGRWKSNAYKSYIRINL